MGARPIHVRDSPLGKGSVVSWQMHNLTQASQALKAIESRQVMSSRVKALSMSSTERDLGGRERIVELWWSDGAHVHWGDLLETLHLRSGEASTSRQMPRTCCRRTKRNTCSTPAAPPSKSGGAEANQPRLATSARPQATKKSGHRPVEPRLRGRGNPPCLRPRFGHHRPSGWTGDKPRHRVLVDRP